MSEIADYLKHKIAEVQQARFIGEIIWALGACISFAGLFLRNHSLTIPGFSLLLTGLYLSVHFELQRLDYIYALERTAHQRNQN